MQFKVMTQNDVKSQEISEDFCIELKLSTVVVLITKFHDIGHCDIPMATQWAPRPLHPMFIQWV